MQQAWIGLGKRAANIHRDGARDLMPLDKERDRGSDVRFA